jgi:hypothetical protein
MKGREIDELNNFFLLPHGLHDLHGENLFLYSRFHGQARE